MPYEKKTDKGLRSTKKLEPKKDTKPLLPPLEDKMLQESMKLIHDGKTGRPSNEEKTQARKLVSMLLNSEKYKEGKKKKIITMMDKAEAFKQVASSPYFIEYSKKHQLTNTEIVKRMVVYIASYVNFGTVEIADSMVSLSTKVRLDWMDACPAFSKAITESRELIADELESVAIERAKAKSDTLLMFLLKAYRPERFRDRVDSNVYNHGESVTIQIHESMLSPAERKLHDSTASTTGVVN